MQPGTMDHYGVVHNVAAAAALQQKGWGNPGNIDGFSELSHAQQLAFAEAQLRATAQQFAAEQVLPNSIRCAHRHHLTILEEHLLYFMYALGRLAVLFCS